MVRFVVAGNDMGGGDARARRISSASTAARSSPGCSKAATRLELLADADVVVYPSEHEIFGLVPLEALLAGTPVVVANDSGCGEVIAAMGGGLVVEGDAGAFDRPSITSSRRQRTGGRPPRKRPGGSGRAYATDVVCAQLEQLYRDMVAAR